MTHLTKREMAVRSANKKSPKKKYVAKTKAKAAPKKRPSLKSSYKMDAKINTARVGRILGRDTRRPYRLETELGQYDKDNRVKASKATRSRAKKGDFSTKYQSATGSVNRRGRPYLKKRK